VTVDTTLEQRAAMTAKLRELMRELPFEYGCPMALSVACDLAIACGFTREAFQAMAGRMFDVCLDRGPP